MRIKNLTSEIKSVTIIDFEGDREFNITIEGNGETELVGAYVKNIHEFNGDIMIVGSPFVASPEPVVVEESPKIPETPTQPETPQVDATQSEDADDSTDTEGESDTPDNDEVVGDKFICDECGAECASARGLSLHKSRAHQE